MPRKSSTVGVFNFKNSRNRAGTTISPSRQDCLAPFSAEHNYASSFEQSTVMTEALYDSDLAPYEDLDDIDIVIGVNDVSHFTAGNTLNAESAADAFLQVAFLDESQYTIETPCPTRRHRKGALEVTENAAEFSPLTSNHFQCIINSLDSMRTDAELSSVPKTDIGDHPVLTAEAYAILSKMRDEVHALISSPVLLPAGLFGDVMRDDTSPDALLAPMCVDELGSSGTAMTIDDVKADNAFDNPIFTLSTLGLGLPSVLPAFYFTSCQPYEYVETPIPIPITVEHNINSALDEYGFYANFNPIAPMEERDVEMAEPIDHGCSEVDVDMASYVAERETKALMEQVGEALEVDRHDDDITILADPPIEYLCERMGLLQIDVLPTIAPSFGLSRTVRDRSHRHSEYSKKPDLKKKPRNVFLISKKLMAKEIINPTVTHILVEQVPHVTYRPASNWIGIGAFRKIRKSECWPAYRTPAAHTSPFPQPRPTPSVHKVVEKGHKKPKVHSEEEGKSRRDIKDKKEKNGRRRRNKKEEKQHEKTKVEIVDSEDIITSNEQAYTLTFPGAFIPEEHYTGPTIFSRLHTWINQV